MKTKLRDRRWYIKFPIYWFMNTAGIFIVLSTITLIPGTVFRPLWLLIFSAPFGAVFASLSTMNGTTADRDQEIENNRKRDRLRLISPEQIQERYAWCPICRNSLIRMYCKYCDQNYTIVEKREWEA